MSKKKNLDFWIRTDRPITLAEIAWLKTPEAQAICREMATTMPADTPATIGQWRQRLEPERVAAAWHQVILRKKALKKFARADEMLFDRTGIEQSTDDTVAAYKARRFIGLEQVADLCCGIGGDALALAEHTNVTAIDWSETKVRMAEHNAAAYGRTINAQAGDVIISRPEADAVHIDPDRRPSRGRRVDPNEGSPDLTTLQQIVAEYKNAAVKLSPAVTFDELGIDGEIELISRKAECKQAVIWTGSLATTYRRATALPSGETIACDSDALPYWPSSRPAKEGDLLYEPDPAVIRADLVGLIAEKYDLQPVDPFIAYLLGSEVIDSDLLTGFRVIDCVSWSIKHARKWLNAHDIGKIDIKTRGFVVEPEEIIKKLRLKGKRRAVLFLTRIDERAIAILTERL